MMIMTETMPRRADGVLAAAQLHHVTSRDEVEAFWRWAGERREILCADTESAGLAFHRDRHRMTQVGDQYSGWAFPPGWMGAAHEVLDSYAGRIGWFNSPYDRLVLRCQSGLTIPAWKVHDAQLACHLADSAAILALKPRTARDIDPSALALERELSEGMKANGWDWRTVPDGFPPYWRYGAMDAVSTSWLLAKHLPGIMSRYRRAYELELGYAGLCADMMGTGMMIDIPYIEQNIREIGAWQEQALAWLRDNHGVVSPASNDQVGWALGRAGVRNLVTTPKTGKTCINKEAMDGYAAHHPEAGELIRALQYAVKAGKILDQLRKFLVMADDGVVHYSIHSVGAQATGRSSITSPAIQTLDRDVRPVRGSFIPRPGYRFVSIDADQVELRLGAHFSGDAQLIEDFRRCDEAGTGFFLIFSSRLYGRQVDKREPLYTATKNTVYSMLFGAQLNTAAATAGISAAQAAPIYDGFKAMYPGLAKMMRDIISENESRPGRPYVETLSGRHLTLNRDKLYTGTDYKIQGSAAEIMKQGGIDMAAAGLGPMLRMSQHDEWLAEVPERDAEAVLRQMTQILTNTADFKVPLTWSGKVLDHRWEK
jgi:DNA polymerase-1